MTRQEFTRTIAEIYGEPFVFSYVQPSGFTEGAHPILYPWSYVAEERLKDRAIVTLRRLGVKLGPVIAEHLKPKTQRAA